MANPTTNYGWPMPTATDLVTDLPADFAAFGQPVDTSLKALNPETTLGDISYRSATSNTNTRLGIGTTGQVLSVVAGVPAWTTGTAGDIEGVTAGVGISGGGTSGTVTVTNSMATAITTAGDLIKGTGSGTFDRLGIGSTSQVLTVVAGAPAWATPASGGGMTLLSTTSLSGASTTISSISGAYTNLYIVFQDVYYASSAGDSYIRLNGDTGSNYSYGAFGMQSGVFYGDQSNAIDKITIHKSGGSSATLLNKINGAITINRYTETTQVNGVSNATGFNNTSSRQNSLTTPFVYDCSAAITSITFFGDFNFSGGTVYVYGVK